MTDSNPLGILVSIHLNDDDLALLCTAIAFYECNYTKAHQTDNESYADLYSHVLHAREKHIALKTSPRQIGMIVYVLKYLKHNFKDYKTMYAHDDDNNNFTFNDPQLMSLGYQELKSLLDWLISFADKYHQKVPTPKQLNKIIDKYVRFAEHSFIREALDALFDGAKVDQDRGALVSTTILGGLTMGTTLSKSFNSHHAKILVVPAVIAGAKYGYQHHKLSKHVADQRIKRMHMAQRMNLKYVLCEFNKDKTIAHFHKVKLANVKKLAKYMKQMLKHK